jgi:hypothetical protein
VCCLGVVEAGRDLLARRAAEGPLVPDHLDALDGVSGVHEVDVLE